MSSADSVRLTEPTARITVVGGLGAVGAMLVELLGPEAERISVVDKQVRVGAERCGVDAFEGDVTRPSDEVRELLASSSVIVLAVPEHVALAAIPATRECNALVVDTLSVKSRLAAAVAAVPAKHEYLGLNPMFRPSLGPSGRAVLAVPYVDGRRCTAFLRLVRAWGADVAVMSADKHDRLVSATQVLTHASVLAFGLALTELGITPAELLATAPPPHRALLALLARTAGGDREVYWDVQSGNPYASTTRSALLEAIMKLDRATRTLGDFALLMETAETALDGHLDLMNAECEDIFARVRGVDAE